jgi:hypothetical protein
LSSIGDSVFVYDEAGGSEDNRVSIRGFTNATGVNLTLGSEPKNSDTFDIKMRGGGSNVGDTQQRRTGVTFTGDGVQQIFSASHNLVAAPNYINVSLDNAVARDAGPVSYGLNSSTVDIKFASPIPDTETASVSFKVEL